MADKPSALPAPGADDVLWLIDLSNYVFRAYHALPPLSNSHGEPTNATLGTLNMLNRMIEDNRPSYLGVVMDSPGRGFRGEIDPEYKANRSAAPEDLKQQLRRTREIFEAYGVPIFQQDGYEADDIIATLTKKALKQGLRVVIASTDKDLMQLVVPGKVWCWDAMRNKVYGEPEVIKKFGVPPTKLLQVLSLIGDTSDNVPGVPGVGPKTAAKLIDKFGDVETIFASLDEIPQPKLNQNLTEHQDAVRRAMKLVALREDAEAEIDRDALKYGRHMQVERLEEIFTELQFTRFLEMLDVDADSEPAPDSDRTPTYRCVRDDKLLQTVLDEARQSGCLAIQVFGPTEDAMRTPLTGIALSSAPGNAAYVPIGHRYLTVGRQIDMQDLQDTLGPALADPALPKIGHDVKFTEVVLARHGMPMRGVIGDTMIASYLYDPETTHKIGIVAEKHTRMKWTDFEKLVPKTKKGPKLTIEEIEVELATPYGCAHAEAEVRLHKRFDELLEKHGLMDVYRDLELPLREVLVEMEQRGVLVDPKQLEAYGEEMEEQLARLEKEGYEAAGQEFNLASPRQLETILFDELGLKSSKKTKTGRSTDHEALEAIADQHPLPKLILEHRALSKLKGTYVDALPKLIHPQTGRIHTQWNQAVAATGRLSSKDPNLQNIPIRTEEGKRIREAFVAPAGTLLLSADYSQIELRVLAHLSHDPKLVEAFNTGQDVHVRTAMEVFGVAEKDVTPTMRAQSKTVNFGVIYGMGPVALGKRLGISRNEAKGFISAYFERYEGVRTFMERTLAEAQKTKSVRTLLGRRRLLPDLTSSNRMKRAYAERIAQNTPIQGTAADLLKLAMVKLRDPVVPGARMVLTVHDELVFEIPEDAIEEAKAKTRQIMESIFELDVPLVVDVGHGANWAAAH
ncbi:MAG TPA: DNA polymerase I [Polyangiaceae bacterium]|nr:DNA polymerase I [Polyangiaceae bacterium]